MSSEFKPISDAMIRGLNARSDAPFAIWQKIDGLDEPLLMWPGNRALSAEDIAKIKENKHRCLVLAKIYFA